MKNFMLFVLLILLISCNTSENKKDSDTEIAQEEDIELLDSQENLPNEGAGSALYTDLGKFLAFLDTGEPLIPAKFYSLLGLDSTSFDQYYGHYDVALQSDNPGKKILVIHKQYDCTAVTCMWGIRIYTIADGSITGGEEIQMSFQAEQTYSLEHDMFLIVSDMVYDWEESESGAMDATSEAYNVDYYIVLFEDNATMIDDFSNEELRIIRNYIFAKYGYKFKSDDLQEYFSKFKWYAPQFDNVDDKITDVDKKIIAHIRKQESK
ncbi:YARHG domain-containing protein [Bacteroidota bacterium]